MGGQLRQAKCREEDQGAGAAHQQPATQETEAPVERTVAEEAEEALRLMAWATAARGARAATES